MPLISIKTSIKEIEHPEDLLQSLSKELARLTGKPEKYVMSILETGIPISFSGDLEPSCYIEIKSIGSLKPSLMSEVISNLVQDKMNIPVDRIYINFDDVSAANWGYNGSTFG